MEEVEEGVEGGIAQHVGFLVHNSRVDALDFAIRSFDGHDHVPTDLIVNRAEEFAKFLDGKDGDV